MNMDLARVGNRLNGGVEGTVSRFLTMIKWMEASFIDMREIMMGEHARGFDLDVIKFKGLWRTPFKDVR